MLWDRQILLPSIAQAVGGLNPSLPSISAAAYIGSKGEILAKSRCFPLCPPTADSDRTSRHVRKVPTGDIRGVREDAN
jgi:hypothetical protein